MYFTETCHESVNWIQLAVMKFRVP